MRVLFEMLRKSSKYNSAIEKLGILEDPAQFSHAKLWADPNIYLRIRNDIHFNFSTYW